MLIAKLISFVKETLTDAIGIFISKEGVKGLFQVSLYRNAIYLIINAAVSALTGALFWMAASRLYTTEAVGLSSAAIAVIGLLALLSTLGLDYGLVRFLPGSGKQAKDMINSCLSVGGLISIALAFIFLTGLGSWLPALLPIRENPIFFATFILFTLASTLQGFAIQAFIAERRAGFALAQGLTFSLVRFIPIFILVSLFDTFGIFVSWGIALFIATVSAILLFLPRVQSDYCPLPIIKRQVLNKLVRFSFANYIANIFWAIPILVLPIMVVNILGAEQNAYFYIGWSVASILFIIPVSISFSLFAEGSYDEKKLYYEMKRSLKFIFILLVPAIIILSVLDDKILLLFGQAYSENSTKLIWILALSALPLSINHIYFSVRRVEKRMKSVIALTAFLAISILGMSYFLLPLMGIQGAGVAWLSSQGVVTLIVIYDLWRRHL